MTGSSGAPAFLNNLLQLKLRTLIRDVEAVIFQPLPLPLTKNEKTTVDNFFKLL